MSHRRTRFALFCLILFSASTLCQSGFADHHEAMKFARVRAGSEIFHALVEGDRATRLSGDLFGAWTKTDDSYALSDVEILVPTTPSKVFALAGNYLDHLGDQAPPATPEPFFKLPTSLLKHEGLVVQPPDTEAVHYEAEVVIVIGKRARNVSVDDAMSYVLGITCGNDISARVWQRGDTQWWRGKGSDTFGPCGPFVVTGIDFSNLDVTLRVNGEVRQKTNTANMIHSLADAVSFISQHVTLEPGDLIYTGTPGKTLGMQPGDVVEVEIEKVGVLRNRIVAARPQEPVRFARFRVGSKVAYGVVDWYRIREIDGTPFGDWKETGQTYALHEVEVLVPTTPSKVFALAGNYRDHLGDSPVPVHPEPFIKAPSCLQRHEGPVVQPKNAEPVHYEAEVVVVIGKEARNVHADDAMDYVLGITCGNDISARAWQQKDVQWWRAKASDTFGPCGPYITSGIDFGNLEMVLRVNGEVRQRTNTRNMIHGIAEAVSFISRHATLKPGDLIFTGTPGKTRGMKIGDVVEVEIEGVGVLRNTVVPAE